MARIFHDGARLLDQGRSDRLGRECGQAAPLMADRANNVSSQPAAMVVGINFPTLGCWEITGRYGDDTLTFVVWLAK